MFKEKMAPPVLSPFGKWIFINHSIHKFQSIRNKHTQLIRNTNPKLTYHYNHLLLVDLLQQSRFVHHHQSRVSSHHHNHLSWFSFSFSSMNFTTRAASELPQSSPTKTVRVVIKGRVQGVFYRNWTIENANELGLKGWVRNKRDGSVEALFSGPPDSVHEMEERCRRGPPASMVTSLQVFPCSDEPGSGFERKPTA